MSTIDDFEPIKLVSAAKDTRNPCPIALESGCPTITLGFHEYSGIIPLCAVDIEGLRGLFETHTEEEIDAFSLWIAEFIAASMKRVLHS